MLHSTVPYCALLYGIYGIYGIYWIQNIVNPGCTSGSDAGAKPLLTSVWRYRYFKVYQNAFKKGLEFTWLSLVSPEPLLHQYIYITYNILRWSLDINHIEQPNLVRLCAKYSSTNVGDSFTKETVSPRRLNVDYFWLSSLLFLSIFFSLSKASSLGSPT
jgi:hypothetical protein